MVYPIIVTTWSLFQLRSLGLELVKRRTTPNALSFGCRIIMGLSFPLVFFYLAWIAENGVNDGDWMYIEIPMRIWPDNSTDSSSSVPGGNGTTPNATAVIAYGATKLVVNTLLSSNGTGQSHNMTDSRNMTSYMGVGPYYMPPSFTTFYPLAEIPFIKHSFGSIYPILLLSLIHI